MNGICRFERRTVSNRPNKPSRLRAFLLIHSAAAKRREVTLRSGLFDGALGARVIDEPDELFVALGAGEAEAEPLGVG